MTRQEFEKLVFDKVKKCPTEWRIGQAIFNSVDELFGSEISRRVQFDDRIDCFFNNEHIELFLDTCWNYIKDKITNNYMENIADILRNAPQGIKLYSPAFGDCKLSCVIEDGITIEYSDGKNPNFVILDQYGRFIPNGSCILFPSKSAIGWRYWQEHLFREDKSIGHVVIDMHLGGFCVIGEHDKSVCLYDSVGNYVLLRYCNLSNYRYATTKEIVEFFEKVEKNNCNWDNKTKAILKNTEMEEFTEEPKNNSKFIDGDIVTIVKHNKGWTDYYTGIVIGSYVFGSDLSKTPINKALRFEIRYATEHEMRKCLSEWKKPEELPYTDEEASEFANMVSHEWWQVAMDKWNTLTEDEKKKYNQYIGFNDFSDQLMNILISVLLGLKRNGKLIYEEDSLFSEPEQKPAKIEFDETPSNSSHHKSSESSCGKLDKK